MNHNILDRLSVHCKVHLHTPPFILTLPPGGNVECPIDQCFQIMEGDQRIHRKPRHEKEPLQPMRVENGLQEFELGALTAYICYILGQLCVVLREGTLKTLQESQAD